MKGESLRVYTFRGMFLQGVALLWVIFKVTYECTALVNYITS